MKNRVLALMGPTAVGKTEYTVRLAQQMKGEIISADSVQIYEHMIIGSARPSPEELALIPHHMIGNISPFSDFTVADYKNYAEKAVGEVIARGGLPIVSGGTGLYLNALLYEMDFNQAPAQPELRKELEEYYRTRGRIDLHERLAKSDPDAAFKIHPNNVKRVMRAIEIVESTGKPMAYFENIKVKNKKFDFVLVCLNRNRENLYSRIDQRVDIMMEKGLLDEVKALAEMGLSLKNTSMQAIGYKELFFHLEGKISLDEAVEKIKQNSRNYAKRQLTWFRRYNDTHWFELSENGIEDRVLLAIKELVV